MTALREHVERAVRPVRALVRRKDRMREELLAHLASLVDEERARCGGAGGVAEKSWPWRRPCST
jgi:hypothetical protein